MVRSQVFAITKSTSTLKSLSASRRDSSPLEFHFKKKTSQSCEETFTVKAEIAPIRGLDLRLLGILSDAFETMELFSTPTVFEGLLWAFRALYSASYFQFLKRPRHPLCLPCQ